MEVHSDDEVGLIARNINSFFSSIRDIIIEISNNGGNIPEDLLEKIFTPYFSTKKTRNGVGLSLYIAKMIVELHLKGQILVENQPLNTVVFKVILPMDV